MLKKFTTLAAAAALMLVCGSAAYPQQNTAAAEDTEGKKAAAVISAVQYGANGGDKKDDYAAIQAALDADLDMKKTVTLPNGVFYISDTLVIHSDTTLRLSDYTRIVRQDEKKLMLTAADDTGVMAGGYSHADNITISGGEWDGAIKNAQTPNSIFNISHVSGLTISDTYIHDFCGSHAIIVNASENVTIKNVNIDGFVPCVTPGKSGNAWYQEAIHIDYAAKEQSIIGYAGPLDDTTCRSVLIEGCTIKNAPAGVGTHHDYNGLYEDNIRITKCEFENLEFAAVNAYGFTNVEISLNKASGCRAFAIMKKSTGEIFGNSSQLYSDAAKTSRAGQLLLSGCDVSISGNTFKGGSGSAILAADGSQAKISANTISDAGSAAIKVTKKSNVQTADNIISGGSGFGVYLSGGSSVKMQRDRISGCKKRGIYAADAKKLTAENVRAVKCSGGIFSQADSVTLKSCTFRNNSGDGIYLQKGSASVTSCTSTENDLRGIVVKNAKIQSLTSKFYKNKLDEIYLDKYSKGTMRQTTIGGSGVVRKNGSTVSVLSSKYRLNEGRLKLTKSSYRYTGKPITPKYTVKFDGKTLKLNRDYKLTLKNNTRRGKATIIVKGIGDYKGQLKATFTIK